MYQKALAWLSDEQLKQLTAFYWPGWGKPYLSLCHPFHKEGKSDHKVQLAVSTKLFVFMLYLLAIGEDAVAVAPADGGRRIPRGLAS